MREIELTRGKYAVVDDEDYERINSHSWAAVPNPYGGVYAVRKGSKRKGEPRTIQMHREILNAPKGSIIDHVNGDGLDNRKSNLRFANTQKNSFNRKKPNLDSTSRYKGVLQRKGSTNWIARIKFNNRHVELGTYGDEAYAASVYNFASRIFFGEFRRENVGPEIPELSCIEQNRLFLQCQKYIERYGWYVDTKAYRSFYFRIFLTEGGRV